MENKLNMTLDELAEMNKRSNRGRGRGRGRGSRRGISRRGRGGYSGRSSRPRTQGVRKDSRRRLRITNLNKSITNDKLKTLFEEYGKLTRCGVHFDKMGDSKGTADIEYESHEDAEKAIGKLNNAEIDGEVMKIVYAVQKRKLGTRKGRRSSFNGRARKYSRGERPQRRTRGRRNISGTQQRKRKTSASGNTRRVQRFKKTIGRKRK